MAQTDLEFEAVLLQPMEFGPGCCDILSQGPESVCLLRSFMDAEGCLYRATGSLQWEIIVLFMKQCRVKK